MKHSALKKAARALQRERGCKYRVALDEVLASWYAEAAGIPVEDARLKVRDIRSPEQTLVAIRALRTSTEMFTEDHYTIRVRRAGGAERSEP